MADETPLAGVRVLECVGWNGVFAGRLLAEAGADVVRAVPPGGDPLDAEPPFFAGTEVSIQAAWYNAGKRIVTVDPATGAGRGQLLELVSAADILIEDWDPAAQPLSGAELGAANPALVRVSVTAAGREPAATLHTNDLVANALCGSASVTGDAASGPISGWGNQTYHTVGMYAALCALASLRAARLTGTAQHVDLSAHEALVSCTEQLLMEWFFPFSGLWGAAGSIAPRQGGLHWSGSYAVYPGKTGQGIQITSALRFVEEILPWMEADGLAQELTNKERYPTFLSMVLDLPYVMEVMREWVATKDPVQLFFEAQQRRLPWGIVYDIPDAIATPQVTAREFVKPVTVPGVGDVPFPGRMWVTDRDRPLPGAAARVSVRDLGWDARDPVRPAPGGIDPSRPLTGVRVLDFTHVLAGPFGTRALADLGADIIKVATADRSTGANNPTHPYYASWNRNKRAVSLNMRTEAGRDIARRLAEQSDLVIENFSAGVIARWGLDRCSLAESNPGVSVISMGGMGQTGPWKDFVTFAPTIHALIGLTYLTNPPGEHLLGYGFSLTDHLSGLAGAIASLEALEHSRRTGVGLEIDISQYDLGLGLMAPTLIDHLANGTRHEPVGNRHPFEAWAPHGIYRAAGDDKWVAIAVRGDEQWAALCRVMTRPDLIADPRFATHAARVANQDALDEAISAWTANRDRYAVMAACQAAGIPAGAVQNAADLTGSDPILAARQFFGTATAMEPFGEYGVDKFPALFNGRRPAIYEGSRSLGQDTFDVVTGMLGVSDEEFAALIEAGALA